MKEEDEFWKLVDKRGPDDCWEWKGVRFKARNGNYGRFKSMWKAHRVAFEYANGGKPPRGLVRHTCDNPPCCNPRHLIVGSNADNMRDKRERLRAAQQWGESHGMAVLSDAECQDIRARFEAGESFASIHRASYPHVSYGSVWAIGRGLVRTNGSGVTTPKTSGRRWKEGERQVADSHGNRQFPNAFYDDVLGRFDAGETVKSIHETSYSHLTYRHVWGVVQRARGRIRKKGPKARLN